MDVTFAGIFGALFGSFLNVVAYRLPRKESVVFGSSHCPQCGAPLRIIEILPPQPHDTS